MDWKGEGRRFAISRTGMGAAVSRIGTYSDISETVPRRSSKNRVFATGWVFSGQRYLLRIAGNFTSLESSRGTRSHAIVVARKLPRFIFTILSKFLFYEKSPRLVYQTFKYLHPFFFVFLVFFFQMHYSEGNQKIFLSLSRTNVIIPVDFHSFGGIFGSISPPIIRSSRRENAHQREG